VATRKSIHKQEASFKGQASDGHSANPKTVSNTDTRIGTKNQMDPKSNQSLLSQPHTPRNPNTLFKTQQTKRERKEKEEKREETGGWGLSTQTHQRNKTPSLALRLDFWVSPRSWQRSSHRVDKFPLLQNHTHTQTSAQPHTHTHTHTHI
jgi:hypothetical protein